MKRGLVGTCSLSRNLPAKVSLVDRMPPVYQQALRGTCVASAVTALVEYYENCKTRLSVQFLEESTKRIEREWIVANLSALRGGRAPDAEFVSAYPAQVAQLKLVIDANGADSAIAQSMMTAFEGSLKGQFNDRGGSLLGRCFQAVEKMGICRYSLWPYVNMQVTRIFSKRDIAGDDGSPPFPPGAEKDAARHRVLGDFYLLRSPNNVDEIRGILAGANNRRPMPVAACMTIFAGCSEEGVFDFPPCEERDGRILSAKEALGRHGTLLVGYRDDPSYAGGGYFIVRNSWGDQWGERGYGRVSYAYVECFCNESGTILEDMVDYLGDGYGGMRTLYGEDAQVIRDSVARRRRRAAALAWMIASLVAVAALFFFLGRLSG